jgi:hypothetical protein
MHWRIFGSIDLMKNKVQFIENITINIMIMNVWYGLKNQFCSIKHIEILIKKKNKSCGKNID